ncbi:Uncharacterised protein [Mycobacteroides abscessus]|nr:Uncharacterised protein [Mycobacteroides abscessus]
MGYLRRSANTRPVSTRSGEKTRWKSSPSTSPEISSSMGFQRWRVVPTGSVVSYETSVPGVRFSARDRVAASIHPKSGSAGSSSTNSGTTSTTASAPGTASA